jgi:hypothetical protein
MLFEGDAMYILETLLVRLRDRRIFVDSNGDGRSLRTLAQWRADERGITVDASAPASSAPAAVPAPAVQLGRFTVEPGGVRSSPGGLWSALRVQIELNGPPRAGMRGRTLSLTVRKPGGDHANEPPLHTGTQPAPDLDENGRASVVFEVPHDGNCGQLMVTFELSGPPGPEQKRGVLILDCR